MTPTEILREIQKLPLGEVQKVSQGLDEILDKDDLEKREQKFAEYLLQKGAIEKIPLRDETDEEFDEFELMEFEGEPLSEQIIRERI